MLQLGGKAYGLTWDNAALFRADDIGLPEKLAAGKFGFSTLARMVWAMLDASGIKAFPAPLDVANALSQAEQAKAWAVVMQAYAAGNGTGDTEAKKESGGSEHSPASN